MIHRSQVICVTNDCCYCLGVRVRLGAPVTNYAQDADCSCAGSNDFGYRRMQHCARRG